MAASGVVGTASTMPVVSPVMMSVNAIARGSNPFALNHCTIRSLPADVQSFVFFNSSSVRTGFFVNTCVQPPCPQLTRTNPFASTRFAISGVSFAVTSFSSSYESKKNGTSKTLNDGSTVPRPTFVNAAARRLTPVGAHLLQALVPDRVLGHDRGELDRDRSLGGRRSDAADDNQRC